MKPSFEEREKNIKEQFYDAFPLCFPKAPYCGFGTGEGWYPLIKNLCASIEAELEKLPPDLREFQVSQVKEKFGGLRFYYDGPSPNEERQEQIKANLNQDDIRSAAHENWQWRKAHNFQGTAEYDWSMAESKVYHNSVPEELKIARDKIAKLVNDAESQSMKICEGCGEPGTARGKNWIKTQCDACEKEDERQRKLDERKYIIRKRAYKNAGGGEPVDWKAWQDFSEEKKNAFIEEAEKQLLNEGGIKPVNKY